MRLLIYNSISLPSRRPQTRREKEWNSNSKIYMLAKIQSITNKCTLSLGVSDNARTAIAHIWVIRFRLARSIRALKQTKRTRNKITTKNILRGMEMVELIPATEIGLSQWWCKIHMAYSFKCS